ncbi:transposase [Coleofasciculus sp. G2-EDA-02]
MWREFEPRMASIYSKKVMWNGSYFVFSCGGVTIEALKVYIQQS